ncbi:hypothetical protein L195_g034255 [Trifolium pratense]|uniref:Uncharacterized protein n=1 Tax=Trifolium pratense TaxID=57577 RepID=A0A2K3LIB7_TRIPR|nr:hypothetical protein L195_g034255 [Trifolium pratense]
MLQLVEPPKILGLVWSQAILREDGRHSGGQRVGGTDLITPESEEGAVNLVSATKHPMVVGGKIFMMAEGIPRDEGEEQLVGSRWRVVPKSRFKWDLDLAGDLE